MTGAPPLSSRGGNTVPLSGRMGGGNATAGTSSLLMSYNGRFGDTGGRAIDNSGVVTFTPNDYLDAIHTRQLRNTHKKDVMASKTG